MRGDMTIRGKAYVPRMGGDIYPTVILSHGYGSCAAKLQAYASSFAENGYATVAFDFCGGAADSTSDGDPLHMSVFTEREDLKTVFSAVSALPFADPAHIFLAGESQGGLVSAMAAADLADSVKGLILLYPAFSIADDARAMYASPEQVPEQVNFMGLTIGKAYYEGLFDFYPLETVKTFSGPVLILHGRRDRIVPYAYAIAASQAYPSARLVPLETAGHGFYGDDRSFAILEILAFLDQNAQ